MPLIMSPCAQDEASTLAHAHHLATSIRSPSSSTPSKHHYLKVTDTSTNEVAAYAIWISLTPRPRPPQRYYYYYNNNKPPDPDHDHDPWRLSSSQLAIAITNDDNSGLYIGMKERLWSGYLYRAARAASTIRRFGFGMRASQCGKIVALGGGGCCVGSFIGVSNIKRA